MRLSNKDLGSVDSTVVYFSCWDSIGKLIEAGS